MIAVLTWLTVGYAVVLVLVLASALITVLWALWRIGTALGQIKLALADVAHNAEPLDGVLTPVNEWLVTVAAALVSARDDLAATDTRLAAVVPTVPETGSATAEAMPAPKGARP